MHDVEFRVLGPLELLVHGKSVPLRGAKNETILAVLLMANRQRESVDRLVEAVWGGAPPPTAVKQVRNAVSDLRRALHGSSVDITPIADCYQLDLSRSVLDAHSFQLRVAQARKWLVSGPPAAAVAEFRAALSLWNGPALSGLDSPVLQAVASALQEERLTVLEECIDLQLRQGNDRTLVRELSQLAADNPLRERIAAQLIFALHRSGARERAFAVYDRTRRALAAALGVDPGQALQDLHRQMLLEEAGIWPSSLVPSRPTPTLDNLPPDLATFTGRVRELADLVPPAERPGDPPARRGRVLVIDGMGGVGKTALAVHIGHRLAPRFPDGRFFLDLHGHAVEGGPLTTRNALIRLLRIAGGPVDDPPDTIEDLAALWRDRVAGRRVLLVLDNAANSRHVQPLVLTGPGCLTVVTSRRHLTMVPEARVHSLDVLSPADAQDLFHRLTDGRYAHDDQRPHVDTVLACSGHLPLAIVMAATRLRHRPAWPLSYLATRLADPRRRLAELRTESWGVTECFDASYHQLSADWQRLLLLLCQIPEPDADTVAGLAAVPVRDIEHTLECLVDEHVLEQPEPGRYRMHELLKIYCAERAGLLDAAVA
ncbi:MAG TPA: BTAD domain-containing putative transcriptional regulator [Pseudonocardiaceae bacterium]|jgi:DNA-binding SARP family transcriptional activator